MVNEQQTSHWQLTWKYAFDLCVPDSINAICPLTIQLLNLLGYNRDETVGFEKSSAQQRDLNACFLPLKHIKQVFDLCGPRGNG